MCLLIEELAKQVRSKLDGGCLQDARPESWEGVCLVLLISVYPKSSSSVLQGSALEHQLSVNQSKGGGYNFRVFFWKA